MTPPNPNDKILTYNDAVLHRSDLEILRSSSFINDRLIHFYFTHLSINQSPLLLLPPSISFYLSNCPNTHSLSQFAEPLNLQNHDLILFTINNNDDPTLAEGGSHWSLLVYERGDNVFVHHDSCDGLNNFHARRMCDGLKGLFGGEARFVVGRTPRQRNGYDCGVYVMAVARVICEWFENGKEGDEKWIKKLEMEVDEEVVGRLRVEVLDLIESLRGGER